MTSGIFVIIYLGTMQQGEMPRHTLYLSEHQLRYLEHSQGLSEDMVQSLRPVLELPPKNRILSPLGLQGTASDCSFLPSKYFTFKYAWQCGCHLLTLRWSGLGNYVVFHPLQYLKVCLKGELNET